jgi:hypothetical protein
MEKPHHALFPTFLGLECHSAGFQSLNLLQASAKPKASAPTATAKQPEVATPQTGLRTPLLLRNAYSAGLARVFATRTLSNPAPAATVMEVVSHSCPLSPSLFRQPLVSELPFTSCKAARVSRSVSFLKLLFLLLAL